MAWQRNNEGNYKKTLDIVLTKDNMKDTFFTQENCDRCSAKLTARTMSWFTDETICFDCSTAELKIKTELKNNGHNDMEGCGYIPNPEDMFWLPTEYMI